MKWDQGEGTRRERQEREVTEKQRHEKAEEESLVM